MNEQRWSVLSHDRNQVKNVRKRLNELLTLVGDFKWMSDAYLSDFFTLEHWPRLKPSWRDALENMDLPEITTLLVSPHEKSGLFKNVWPLSLLAYRACAHGLSLCRHPMANESLTSELNKLKLTPTKNKSESADELAEKCCQENDGINEIKDGQCLMLEHCYRRHVKPKKQHEILRLAKTVRQLCDVSDVTHVIDVGAGQGHLCRVLSFGYGLHVTTIEASGCHAPKAEKFDREVQRDISRGQHISKKKKKLMEERGEELGVGVIDNAPEPSHVVAWIDSDISVGQFLIHVNTAQQDQPITAQQDQPITAQQDQQVTAQQDQPITAQQDQQFTAQQDQQTTAQQDQLIIAEQNLLESISDPNNSSGDDLKKMYHDVNTKDDEGDGVRDEGVGDGVRGEGVGDGVRGEGVGFALTGLHACGDLTSTMLRVFVRCPRALTLAAVGCCYMKMDTHLSERGDRELGYPLSEFVTSLGHGVLSWEAREMACHFTEAYHHRLKEAIQDPGCEAMAHLRTHCYRAALQEIIVKKNPDANHGSIKLTLKKTHLLPFKDYATKALKRLGLDPSLTEDMLELAETRLKQWKTVVAFYTLRLALAPVFESIILLDRMLYLAENGINTGLVPLFDPAISPRNFVLLAAK